MFRPILWIAAAFTVGIAAGRWSGLTILVWLAAATACVLLAAGLYAARVSAPPPLLCAVLCLGAILYLQDARSPPDDPFAELDRAHVTLTGVVVQPPQPRRERMRVVVAVEDIRSARGGVRRVAGRVQVTVRGRMDLRYGDRIRASGRLLRPPAAGNPGEFSYREYLAVQGIAASLYPGRTDTIRVLARGRGSALLGAVFAIRSRILACFAAALPGPRGALLSSLLLGDDGAVSPETRTAFTRAGLLHILVVSGAQVGLIMGTVIWLARLLRAPPLLSAGLAVPAVLAFALMAGWVPSVARAAVMAVLAAGALAWGRAYDVFAALALAVVVLLGSAPRLLFNAGFQLSFVATWALVYVAPVIATRLTRLPKSASALVSMTVAAQFAVLPILAYHFLQISVSGFAANLVVIPIVAVLVPAGFGASLIGLALPQAAGLIAWLLAPPLDLLGFLARLFASLPGAAVAVYPPSIGLIAGFYILCVAVVEWMRGRIRLRRGIVLAAISVALAAALWIRVASASPAPLTVTVLDVGQGDAIVVRGPSGQTLLIDGGGEVEGHLSGYDVGVQRVVPALRRLGVRTIDVVVLSHAHEDHVGGLVAVLQNFSVGVALDSGLAHPAPSYARFLQLIEAHHVPYRLARRGMRIDFGDGIDLTVLLPQEPLLSGSGSDVNLNSVVLRLTYGSVRMLFTGDMEALNESQLLDLGDDLRATMLKVAHHGSRTSTTSEFLDAVRPAVAVISVGAGNPFGHPHPATLETLEAAGAQVYRTDRDGAVFLETDGRRVRVRTYRDAWDR